VLPGPLLPPGAAWADLPADQEYLWAWLASHLWGAGRREELETVLADPRWLVAKLERVGPAGLESDLRLSERARAQALAVVVRQCSVRVVRAVGRCQAAMKV
jgi:hypothetical protein